MSIFININQEQTGPYDANQINQMLNNLQINPECLAWTVGMANWEPLSSPTFTSLGINSPARPHSVPSNPSNIEQGIPEGGGSISISSAIGESFTFFKGNAIGCIGWVVLTGFLSGTGIGALLTPLLGVNLFSCAKRFQETGKKMDLGDLFDFSKWAEKIFGPIVLGIIIFIGFCLLIIPGIILAMRWTFSPCVLADRPNLSFTDAMKASGNVAKGNWINLILLFIIIGLLQILGVICLGIGLLVTIPVGHVAVYFAYAQCKK